MLYVGFIKRYISSGVGGYSVLVNYISLLSSLLSSLQIISLSIKYRQNRLLLESFVELQVWDFMIYQLVNKATEILSIASSPQSPFTQLV